MKETISTEEKILIAGRTLFSKGGYSATSMADIAKEVGTTKASLYYFFKNKQSLYIKILLDLIERVSVVYDKEIKSDAQIALQSAILETILLSKEYGSMLEMTDPSQFDTKAEDFKSIMVEQVSLDKKIQSFLKQCGVDEPKIATQVLNASTHGYLQSVLFGINDISAKKYATYMSKLLTQKN